MTLVELTPLRDGLPPPHRPGSLYVSVCVCVCVFSVCVDVDSVAFILWYTYKLPYYYTCIYTTPRRAVLCVLCLLAAYTLLVGLMLLVGWLQEVGYMVVLYSLLLAIIEWIQIYIHCFGEYDHTHVMVCVYQMVK